MEVMEVGAMAAGATEAVQVVKRILDLRLL
jgi:hypothetical protein